MLPKVTGGAGRAPTALWKLKRRNNNRGVGKYGVSPAEERRLDGILFDSKAEMKRYALLKQWEHLKMIGGLECHPRFPLVGPTGPLMTAKGRQFAYEADFRYRDLKTGEIVIEDTKGDDLKYGQLKRALAEQAYGIKVRVVKVR